MLTNLENIEKELNCKFPKRFHDSIRFVNFRKEAFSFAKEPTNQRVNKWISEN